MIETKKDYYLEVAKKFNGYVKDGLTNTQATNRVMRDFHILSPVTVFNIRRKAEAIENGGLGK